MTEKEILELEKDNYTTIHLHLVGIFWRAYGRSALGYCYSRLWALRHKYPDKKFSFKELYNDICMERYFKIMGGI